MRIFFMSVIWVMLLHCVFAQELPTRPEEIKFDPLSFEAPKAKEYRHVLWNGVPVYMATSQEFPLINLEFHFGGGANLDPAEKVGLASLTGRMLRLGGTKTIAAAALDEEFDFLAANCSAYCGNISSTASLNCLKSNFDQTMQLFMDMLRNPGFDAARLKIQKAEMLENMKQRNDDAGSILSREWNMLLYGREHFEGNVMVQSGLESIDENAMRKLHGRIFQPGNLIIAVSGDFEIKDMLAKLEKALSGWQAGEAMGDPAKPPKQLVPALYHVEKDIPQGKVSVGMRSVERESPDHFALMVMNEILGGGGFTSRITSRVRSDEGLAYSAGSRLSMDPFYPGEFRAYFQSKNRTVAQALKIIFEEIEKIRTQKVSPEELEIAKNSFIETFPRRFESKAGMLRVFVNDEQTKRPEGYWQGFRDKIRAVTADEVMRVASKYLDAKAMAILIVGKWEEIKPGNEHASMQNFFAGQVKEIPLRDPLTMEPMAKE